MPTSPTQTDEASRPSPLSGSSAGQDDAASEAGGPNDPVDHDAAKRRRMNSRKAEASNKAARKREADEDRELIERAQKGDHGAFRILVDRHQRRAFALALGMVRDENDAHELVQEAFLRVYRGLNTFQGGSSFFTWLYRIVTNLAIDLMRKPGRRDAELVEEPTNEDEGEHQFPMVSRIDGADPIDVMRRREIAARLQSALESLPPYHRGVILMREVEGMSYEEMAQAMGVSKGTIMSRLFHARQKLQRTLADCYAEEGPPSDSTPEDFE
ncbi:MAG: sigma-70 family RNA polymerase sigma factor [Byssovorax sp.]